jgi:SAM-dependent methyltransferase
MSDSKRTDALEELRNHWDQSAARSAPDSVRVDASPRAQRMRFAAFGSLELADSLEGATILDVGCGVGDFWAYLTAQGVRCDYLGVDVSSAMIERASAKFPDARFEVRDVLEWDPGRRFDYVIAIGIHNVRIPGVEPLLERVTRRQFELSARAAHVSLLTDRYPGFGPQALSWRAEEVLSMALAVTPHVTLRHDYLPNDFSVTLYREPLIDRRKGLLAGLE